MDLKNLKNSIIVSQHCQRNFDLSKEIPQEDIEAIIFSITNCPSKQNLAFYNVVAIQDREIIESIHEKTYDKAGMRSNPQVLGNLMLVFTERDVKSNFLDEDKNYISETKGLKSKLGGEIKDRNLEMMNYDNEENQKALKTDADIALGIAAGYSTLVSSLLGYRTGCSSCFNSDAVSDILKNCGIAEKPLLLMGIGHNDPSKPRQQHHKNPDFFIRSNVKIPIKVDYI
jgi:nitroreductase